MKRLLFLSAIFLACCNHHSSTDPKQDDMAIRELLNRQIASWNNGDIEGFMQTYWKSDSLMFIGKNGVQRGWNRTLENYKKSYPDKTAMGTLSFDLIELRPLGDDYFFVVGKWMLKRTVGDLSGHYDLLMHRINGRWVIVSDHSS